MPWQDFAIGLLVVLVAGCGWFLRTLWEAVDRLKDNHAKLEANVSNTYARRDDVRDMFNQVLTAIANLSNKLDGKADK